MTTTTNSATTRPPTPEHQDAASGRDAPPKPMSAAAFVAKFLRPKPDRRTAKGPMI
jgi:hypothetical protein